MSSFKKEIKKFDEKGIGGLFISSIPEIIKELIKGKRPSHIIERDRGLIEIYEGIYYTNFKNFKGYEVIASKIEKCSRTPEYISRRFNLSLEWVRRNWGNAKEIIEYGASVFIKIADIDEERSIGIESQRWIDESMGEFLVIKHENSSVYPGVKFDINLKELNEKGILRDEELYNFIEKLVELSKACNVGIEIKPLYYRSNGRIFLWQRIHLYPRCERLDETVIEKLIQVYRKGRDLFGDAFDINRNEISERYSRLRLISRER
jgi:hypothetical protein